MEAFNAVIATCEIMAAEHDYDVTADGCKTCDLDYPCFTRLNAEAVIIGLRNLTTPTTPDNQGAT